MYRLRQSLLMPVSVKDVVMVIVETSLTKSHLQPCAGVDVDRLISRDQP